MINADKSQHWRIDLTAACTAHDDWLRSSGKQAYLSARLRAADEISQLLEATDDLRSLDPGTIETSPAAITILRMCTAPPLARDRLAVLAGTERPIITAMEKGRLPARMSAGETKAQLVRICRVLRDFLDPHLFPWLDGADPPSGDERSRTSWIVADRQCEAAADHILRRARRRHQLDLLRTWLVAHGYGEERCTAIDDVASLRPGRFVLGRVILGESSPTTHLRVDAVIRPHDHQAPILVIKSVSGTDTTKSHQARSATNRRLRHGLLGPSRLLLLLAAPCEASFLHDTAREGMDWIWEHRVDDLTAAGV